MRGRGIIAKDRGGFNRMERRGALEDGLFVGIGFGFVRSGWSNTLVWRIPHVF